MNWLPAVMLSLCLLRLAFTSPVIDLEDDQYLDKEVSATKTSMEMYNVPYDVLTQCSRSAPRPLMLPFPQNPSAGPSVHVITWDTHHITSRHDYTEYSPVDTIRLNMCHRQSTKLQFQLIQRSLQLFTAS
jgi:hypothetical protein